ncbi:serine hydrolase domain-containing protein [Nocardia acidivorans]|uniref:serine hydrolase domain-containing protein n=1 Tax=Nocardia acidivorans TaxID=404580 RepID=UPI00082ED52D|nr:serine hydrolase domain-containing protein [Nocardia acidivorans]
MKPAEIHGTVEPGFEEVAVEYAAVVAAEQGEAGSQLAVVRHGRRVVDLWSGAGVTGDTLTGIYSSSKGVSSLVVALLVQEGLLRLDRPVAADWPEFAAAGKESVTLRDLLTHRSGIVGIDAGTSVAELADDRVVAALVAGQRPHWRLGSAYGYAGFVAFAMVNEVVRRVTGHSLQEHFRERVRESRALDVYLGLPAEQEHRYLPIRPWLATPEQERRFWSDTPGARSLLGIAFALNSTPPVDQVELANDPGVRALGPASVGGVGSARGLAALYAAAISETDSGPALLHADTLGEFTMAHSVGGDLVSGPSAHFALGFQAMGLRMPVLGARAFGHDGSAGSLAYADPDSGIALGYTRRRFAFAWNFPEHARLAAVVARCATANHPLSS